MLQMLDQLNSIRNTGLTTKCMGLWYGRSPTVQIDRTTARTKWRGGMCATGSSPTTPTRPCGIIIVITSSSIISSRVVVVVLLLVVVVVVVPSGLLGGPWTKCMFFRKGVLAQARSKLSSLLQCKNTSFKAEVQQKQKKCSRLGEMHLFEFTSMQQKHLSDLHRKSCNLK